MRSPSTAWSEPPPLDEHPDDWMLDLGDPTIPMRPRKTSRDTLPPPDMFQQDVITATESSLRVIAPAGAGKTQTLVRRVARRIEDGVPPRRILVLTFDRNAKASFERMVQRVGLDRTPDIRTLNAFGWDILRRHFPDERSEIVKPWLVLGSRGINPAGSKHQLIRALSEEGEPKDVVRIFDALKDHQFDPRDRAYKVRNAWIAENYRRLVPDEFYRRFPDRYAGEFALAISDEFRAYEHFLEKHNVIDYQDQKLRTLKLLETYPDVLQRVQERYDEVIVDEVQDINPLDAELIKAIAGQATLVLTGDDDQAIYEFRWASPRFLIDPDAFFGREFRTLELSLNYRCPPAILKHALPLIAHNEGRVPKAPKAHKDQGGEVVLGSADTTLNEGRTILRWIEESRQADRTLRFQDIAILYRANAQHYSIQTELFNHRIPYRVNERFDLRIIWRKALALLEFSSKIRAGEPVPEEDRQTILGLYPALSNLRPADLAAIARAGSDNRRERRLFPDTATTDAIADRMNAGTATHFRSAVRTLTTARSIDEELAVIGSRFFGFGDGAAESETTGFDESPIEELQNIAHRMGKVTREEFVRRFGTFLRKAEADRANAGTNDTGVELSTCHGAKGREWKVVIMPSCNEGRFPDFRSMDGQDLEAERRLFYVSMTRASQRLCISWLTGEEGKAKPPQPSIFLYEAGLIDGPPPQREPTALPLVKAWEQRKQARTKASSSSSGSSNGGSRSSKTKAAKTSSRRSGATGGSGGGATSRSRAGASMARASSGPVHSDISRGGDEPATLPPLDVAMPGKGRRRMDFRRDGDVRRFVGELTDPAGMGWIDQVTIASDTAEETFPLQFALLLNGIPFTIAREDRLLASPHLAAVYRTLTNAEPIFQREIAEPSSAPKPTAGSPYKGLAIRLLVRVAREFGISSRAGTDRLDDAIQHAIRANSDQDERGVRFIRRAAPLSNT
ncbi:MAG: ATP-dependent helicase [Thermomicrobiales bacterium]